MKWKNQLTVDNKVYSYCDLKKVCATFNCDLKKLPYTIRILLESVARNLDEDITQKNVEILARWQATKPTGVIPFKPARVILQDFTGVPAVVDLAAMRDAIVALGGDASQIRPAIPVSLVVDHSVQVDCAKSPAALSYNTKKEFERNTERYQFLKWAQSSFQDFEVIPPETGIIHQVNIEALSNVVLVKKENEANVVFPDTLQGTDSHTTMINGLGVLGWGVGGIEAEAALLGEASYFPSPAVIGVKLVGFLAAGTTATDLALTVTEKLRQENVVGKFVEFFGSGYQTLSLSDRATIANMAPEYGATCGYCPIDKETLDYLAVTGRDKNLIMLVKDYAIANGLFYDEAEEIEYTKVIEINLNQVEPSLAGPKRPQDRIALAKVATDFKNSLTAPVGPHGFGLSPREYEKTVSIDGLKKETLQTGSVVLAAITSCTNTSNPSVMLAAGLLAKKAVEKGLSVPSYVKTSLAPGSKIVTTYLKESGLMVYLEKLGFYLVGYGCTTCIGNSGPLAENVSNAIEENELLTVSVLSGNRNFEGRIHPLIKANYLASPPLVVAYALAGTVQKDLTTTPLGFDQENKAVMLADIWPTTAEINQTIQNFVNPRTFKDTYSNLLDANTRWNAIPTTKSDCYAWDCNSTYIANPPFFDNLTKALPETRELLELAVLAKLGDSVTTDHISPAGAIPLDTPAGRYLQALGVPISDFNSYGARRGNHEIMMRGTFANIRLQNQLIPEKSGGYTRLQPTGKMMSIYDAAMHYQTENKGTIILAGKDYGMGSSRDWAAKGPQLLGVKAVLAESFERIHRSNLVMMGIVPLEYCDNQNAKTLGLEGSESFSILLNQTPQVGDTVSIMAKKPDGREISFIAKLRFDAPADIRYWQNQGILPMVIRKKLNT